MLPHRLFVGKKDLTALALDPPLAALMSSNCFLVKGTLEYPVITSCHSKLSLYAPDKAVIGKVSPGAALALTEEPYSDRPSPRPNNRHPPTVVNYLEVVHVLASFAFTYPCFVRK